MTMLRTARLACSMLGLSLGVLAAGSALAQTCPGNPNALGVSRIVEIDTTGGPGFGNEHFQQHDFLRNGEVVLTFDDGPWETTPIVLAALEAHCTKAIFFTIGKHATYYPHILKQVAEKGHTIGTHTWSHPKDISKLPVEKGKEEIEMGISAVRRAVGDQTSSFLRFPSLKHPVELVKYSAERNIGMWSTDIDSFDFKFAKGSDKLVPSLMAKLAKKGKGILLLHDFHKSTANAVPELLNQLKAGGYKIVQVKGKGTIQSKPEYDALVVSQLKGPGGIVTSDRPTSSVVRTISEDAPGAAGKSVPTGSSSPTPAKK